MSARVRAVLLTMTLVVVSSWVSVLMKKTLREVPPFTFVWLQLGFGGALLGIYTFVLRGERTPRNLPREVWALMALIGVLNFTGVRVLFTAALGLLPATTNAYLVNFVGVATMALSALVLRERPSLHQIAGAVIALAGLRVFFRELPAPNERLGFVYVGTGVALLAVTNTAVRKLAVIGAGRISSALAGTWSFIFGGVPVVAFGMLSDWPSPLPSATSMAVIALSGLTSIALGMALWNYVLKSLRSYEASILAASSVIFTALFAIPMLGEQLETWQWAGIALMLLGLSLSQMRRSPAPKAPDGPEKAAH